MVPPTVIGLGELLWDDFPDGRRPGGAPANVAYHANQLGALGLPASRVGADPAGDELLEVLRHRGIDTRLIQRDAAHPTGRVSVQLTAGGQPSYIIHQHVAWEHLEPTELLLQHCRQADAICFGTLAQRTTPSRDAIHACLRAASRKVLRVYDVNLRQHWYEADWIQRSVHSADVVKFNDEELPVMAGLYDVASGEGADVSDRLFAAGVQTVVVTRGARGCSVYRPGEAIDAASAPMRVVDTVGAGDAFTAAFIVGLLRDWPMAVVALLANQVGGLVASRAGAMPEIAAEAAALIAAADAAAR
jgi:fructokinase